MADYKTRLTADTSQHDNALKRSASQIYQYKKQTDQAKVTLGNLAKKFGPLAAQVGIAGGALQLMNKTITSTEAGTDAMARTMEAAKTSVNHFFKSIATGSFDSFVNGLGDIVTTAKEAYNALDDLGTMKMWKDMRINQLNTQIAEDQVIVRNGNSSSSDIKAAQQRIDLNMQKIQALTGDLIEQTEKASDAVLQKLAGSTLSPTQLKSFIQMRESGTLEQYMKEYKGRMATTSTVTATRYTSHGAIDYDTTQTQWSSDYARKNYEAMQRLYNATDEEVNEWITLQNSISTLRTNAANEQTRANKLVNKGSGSGTGSSKATHEAGSIADLESQVKALQQRLSNEALTSTEAAVIQHQIDLLTEKKQAIEDSRKPLERMATLIDSMPQLDGSIIDHDAINAGLDELIEGLQQVGMTIDDLERIEGLGDSLGYLGDMFSSVGAIAGEESEKIFQAVGQSISAIGEAIAKVSGLMMAEGAASVMDLPFPYNLAALASVVGAATSVIASIKGIASQRFADGGIVQGGTTLGDFNLARVNSGEMILNGTQQARLFRILNNPTIPTTSTDGGNVTFTIHGSDLQGTLTNYNRKRGRVI